LQFTLFPQVRHPIAAFRCDCAVLCRHAGEMRATRFRWWLLVLAAFALGYLGLRDDAPDLTEDLRLRLKSAPGSLYRVVYLEDVARDFIISDWSVACVVQPFANSGDKDVPEALKTALWLGNSNEAEWRIALLDDRRVLQSFILKYRKFRLSEITRSGIECIPRENTPVLRISPAREGTNALLVELGLGDARPSK
jgi:hypothetical protein